MHIHLDPVGGIAGDMFVAAMLDCFPAFADVALSVPGMLGIAGKVQVSCPPHNNGILTGHRFVVTETPSQGCHHHHTSMRDIRSLIAGSSLPDGVKSRSIAIFELLAQAEAAVHGVNVEDVQFHEVGALDSIADITIAACLIEELGAATWSIAPIPMGSGRVMTQHGLLPVPAPATVNLLKGCVVFHDDIAGERVTPTGAAIVRHLNPAPSVGQGGLTLQGSGTGFGTKVFEKIPNILRILAFESLASPHTDRVTIFSFEIDDQTPEDLAIGLECIRQTAGVLDVISMPVMSKKGRVAQHIQILGAIGADRAILDACFTQTTTIGVRFYPCDRAILARRLVDADGVGVKIVQRPLGPTGKAESDDVASLPQGAVARARLAQRAVRQALEQDDDG